jgi:Tol biopolymer transport system component
VAQGQKLAVNPVETHVENPEISPDGTRILVDRHDKGNPDIYQIDVDRRIPVGKTIDAANE